MAEPGKLHASAPSASEPAVAEPGYAERARTLACRMRVGTLSTLSRKRTGWPYGSLMPYAPDERGNPLFLISSMAVHTQNLEADPRASLLICDVREQEDTLGSPRLTLMGEVKKVAAAQLPQIRESYLKRYENARHWVDFGDFAFYRMDIADVYFVGGFGVMGWVSAAEYGSAQADPLADAAPAIISHMNQDHSAALLALAQAFGAGDARQAVMTSVDRLGFEVRLQTGERVSGKRIPFPQEVRSAAQARTVLIEMTRNAGDGERRNM